MQPENSAGDSRAGTAKNVGSADRRRADRITRLGQKHSPRVRCKISSDCAASVATRSGARCFPDARTASPRSAPRSARCCSPSSELHAGGSECHRRRHVFAASRFATRRHGHPSLTAVCRCRSFLIVRPRRPATHRRRHREQSPTRTRSHARYRRDVMVRFEAPPANALVINSNMPAMDLCRVVVDAVSRVRTAATASFSYAAGSRLRRT